MNRLGKWLHGMPMAAFCTAVVVFGSAFSLVFCLAGVWKSTSQYIADSYGKSLYGLISGLSISGQGKTKGIGAQSRMWMEQAVPDMVYTYYLLTSSGSITDSGCNQGSMLPLDYSVLPQFQNGGYGCYTSTHRGKVLAVGVRLEDDSLFLMLFEFSNFRSVGQLMGGTFLMVCIFTGGWILVSVLLLWRLYLSPLKALLVTMRSPEMDEATIPYTCWGNEIGQLCAAYQNRYHDYQNSLQEINQLNTDRRKSEIDVLQNQINAHFIYNTLNNIQWLASADRMEDVIRTAKSLDTLLRGCANNDSDYVRLEEEIAYVEAYLSSQQIRFRSVFDYDFDIDPLLLMEQIPKFIIQPLVENSIYHGFLDAHRRSGHIQVSVKRRGHRIVITVFDNGIGIPHDQIYHILNNTKKSSGQYMGVAIGNINKRIRLLCGREYGLGIESVPGKYTSVEIVIPMAQ